MLLAFDTAQGALSSALLRGGDVIAHRFEQRTRGHAEALMPMLAALLKEAGVGFADIEALAVTIGPGTFTGLRSGLAAARGLALARKLPLVGVTTLEAIAAPVEARSGENIVAAFDARRDEIYLQIFNGEHHPLSEPLLLSLADAKEKIAGMPAVIVGTGAQLLAETANSARISDAQPQPDALMVARIAERQLARFGREKFLTSPAPLYLRLPDAKLPGGLTLDQALR